MATYTCFFFGSKDGSNIWTATTFFRATTCTKKRQLNDDQNCELSTLGDAKLGRGEGVVKLKKSKVFLTIWLRTLILYLFIFLSWKILLNGKTTSPDLLVQSVLAQNKTRHETMGPNIGMWGGESICYYWGQLIRQVVMKIGDYWNRSIHCKITDVLLWRHFIEEVLP